MAASAGGAAKPGAPPGPQPIGKPRLLIGEGQPGMLENLCWGAVLGDPAAPCVDEFLACVKRAGREPQPLAKAQIHAWLASKERPDLRLGEAAGQGYWPFDHRAFDAISAFIRSL